MYEPDDFDDDTLDEELEELRAGLAALKEENRQLWRSLAAVTDRLVMTMELGAMHLEATVEVKALAEAAAARAGRPHDTPAGG